MPQLPSIHQQWALTSQTLNQDQPNTAGFDLFGDVTFGAFVTNVLRKRLQSQKQSRSSTPWTRYVSLIDEIEMCQWKLHQIC